MTFVALQRMTLADGRKVDIGDDVPEAQGWPDPTPWVTTGHLAWVPDGTEDKFRDALAKGEGAELIATAGTLRTHLEGPSAYLRHKRGQAAKGDAPSAEADRAPASGQPVDTTSEADADDAAEDAATPSESPNPNKGRRRK